MWNIVMYLYACMHMQSKIHKRAYIHQSTSWGKSRDKNAYILIFIHEKGSKYVFFPRNDRRYLLGVIMIVCLFHSNLSSVRWSHWPWQIKVEKRVWRWVLEPHKNVRLVETFRRWPKMPISTDILGNQQPEKTEKTPRRRACSSEWKSSSHYPRVIRICAD